jgi:hypothetical protein
MDDKRFDFDKPVPLCKFGPGGDFVSIWPGIVPDGIVWRTGPVRRLLGMISECVGAVISPELFAEFSGHVDDEIKEFQVLAKEKLSDAIEEPQGSDNAPSVRSTCDNLQIRGQTMLFADDCGTGKRIKRKPHHRVRTHRRVAKKKTGDEITGTGTLFETYGKSTTAA